MAGKNVVGVRYGRKVYGRKGYGLEGYAREGMVGKID